MALPPRRKRCSFGGKEGVWWRHKSSEGASHTAASRPEQSFALSASDDRLVAENNSIDLKVQWDDMLARPIYHRSTMVNQVVSSEDDEPSSPSTPEVPNPKRAKASFFQRRTPVRRTKTFGGRSRRPLSLLLSESDARPLTASDSSDRSQGTSRGSNATDLPLDPVMSGRPDSAPVQSPKTASPFDFHDGNIDGLFRVPARCRRTRAQVVQTTSGTPQRPTATSSIQQAQEYFAHLDASCQLQLDDSISPRRQQQQRPSLVRTSRKLQLSSPGFRLEYSKYANASRELEVSPLAPQDYAKARRAFFRKNELFDGFVDS